jgi:hypothetical protein
VVSINLAAGYTAALLKNSGVPGLAIIPDGTNPPRPDLDSATRMKDQFVEKFSGDMAGSPIVFNGPYKLVEVGFSPEKLGLSNLTRDAEARVAAAVGVAAMSLGLPDPNKTYSNLAEANRASWGTVVSLQELVAEGVRFGLLPEPISVPTGTSPGLDPMAFLFTYDYSDIQEMQESLDAVHLRTRNDFRFDLIRKNEAREQLGYDPDPDGDVYFSEIQLALAAAKAGGSDGPAQTDPTDTGPTENPVSAGPPTTGTPRPGKAWMDYLRFPSPTEYPATEGGFEDYLEDCKSHPFEGPVVSDVDDWLAKYNHCHGRDGRFCGGGNRGATGTFTPLSHRPGGTPKPSGGGGSVATSGPSGDTVDRNFTRRQRQGWGQGAARSQREERKSVADHGRKVHKAALDNIARWKADGLPEGIAENLAKARERAGNDLRSARHNGEGIASRTRKEFTLRSVKLMQREATKLAGPGKALALNGAGHPPRWEY